jgi:hypothetical protein
MKLIKYEILENEHKQKRLSEINNFCLYLQNKYKSDVTYNFETQMIMILCHKEIDRLFIITEIEAIKNFGTLEQIVQYKGRRTGNTTRYIDSLIQTLFKEGIIRINVSQESKRILDVICKRMCSEHPFNEFKREQFSIKLINKL